MGLEPEGSIPVCFPRYRDSSLTNTAEMGVAPFTVLLTVGVKSPDAVSLLGKRTHDPCKLLTMKYI